jgi:hypothetical protein
VMSTVAPYENHRVRGNIQELVELDWPATPRTRRAA